MIRLIIIILLCIKTAAGFQDTLTIVHNKFSHRPFGSELTTKDIQNRWNVKFTLKKEVVKNTHSNEIDTLLVFKYKSSQIVFYKSKYKTILQEAIITDPKITLSNQICIGITKKSFLQYFDKEGAAAEDHIIVTNETEYAYHQFIFKDGLLKKIILQMGVD